MIDKTDYIYKNIVIQPKKNKYPEFLIKNLDDSQLKAITHCLMHKISLIQGPPGTSKSYVGSIITDILRENLKKDSKILIVCFTNHALDQFLENILKDKEFLNKDTIVPIGGKCKNENIKNMFLILMKNIKVKDI